MYFFTPSSMDSSRREKLDQTFHCPDLYDFLEKNKLEKIEVGLLVHIYDYMCEREDDGRGSSIIKIYPTYEEAKERNKVYDCPRDDLESAESDVAVELYILNAPDKVGYIHFSLDYLVILDGISLRDLFKSLPVQDIINSLHKYKPESIIYYHI